jgi:hypothetical protein
VSIRKKANPPVNNNTQTNAALRQTLAVQKESSQLSGKIRTSVPGLRSSEFGENERAGGTASKRRAANYRARSERACRGCARVSLDKTSVPVVLQKESSQLSGKIRTSVPGVALE